MEESNRHFPLSTSHDHEQKGENLINIDIRKEKKERATGGGDTILECRFSAHRGKNWNKRKGVILG